MKNKNQDVNAKFKIQKIYIKNTSLNIPQGYKIFNQEWNPKLNVELNTCVNNLIEDDMYEIILTVNVQVHSNEEEAFNIEIQQAGIFTIHHIKKDKLNHIKYVFCPNILYHYAREIVSDIVLRSGFPQLCLATINFDLIYSKKRSL